MLLIYYKCVRNCGFSLYVWRVIMHILFCNVFSEVHYSFIADLVNRVEEPNIMFCLNIEGKLNAGMKTKDAKFHCPFCVYKSDRRFNINSHLGRRHPDKFYKF